MIAICNSHKCSGTNMTGIKKETAKPRALSCPDCGSVLLWKKNAHTPLHRKLKKPKKYNDEIFFSISI